MSYVTEINGFHKWIQTHPELPISARLLWFTLMHYNNSCGWKRVFNVPMSLLMGDSGLSRSSIVRARQILQELGRIRYTTRPGMKATEYELLPMSNEPGIATGYDMYDTRRDTGHDTVYDTPHDTPHDTGRDIEYDTACDIPYDIAHDTQDGHIPRLDQTRQDQTNTIQDTNTRQDNQSRPDNLSEFSFSGGEKKEKEKKENAYRSDNADMHGNTMYDDEMHDGTMYDDTMYDDTMCDDTMHDNKVYDDTVYDDNMRNNKVYDDNMRDEKIKEAEFVPPTVEMVEAYCKERGNVIDPELFVAYYDSIGWVRGKYPMKDWKAAVRSWEKYDAEYRENGYY